MNTELRAVADNIIDAAIKAVLPDEAVKKTLKDRKFDGKVILVAVGKAAWQMAKAASDCIGDVIDKGIVITKYGHVKEPIERIECFEAGHPVPDENSFKATQAAIEMLADSIRMIQCFFFFQVEEVLYLRSRRLQEKNCRI